MDINLKRRAREHAIAAEIADELHRALGPGMPEALGENREIVCEVFGRVFDRRQILTESSGARILGYVPRVLPSVNLKFADLNRKLDAAMPPPARRRAR